MNDTPTRVFGLMCLLVAIWIATYWLYEPAEPRVTFDKGPRTAAGATPPSPQPLAELSDVRPDDSLRPAPPPDRPLGRPPASQPARPPAAPLPAPKPEQPAQKQFQVVPPEFREYVVQSGDAGWETIAQRVYGDRSLWRVVSQANPFVTPDKLIPGRTKLRMPVDPANIQGVLVEAPAPPAKPAPGSPQSPDEAAAPPGGDVEYVIKDEDTLSGISKAFYGKAGLWKRIYDANRAVISDPDSLPLGAKIKIPPR